MESLAYVVVVYLAGLLLCTITALVITLRARRARGHLAAAIFGSPALIAGVQLLVSVDSAGGRIYGMVGILGFAVPAYRAICFFVERRRTHSS